MSVSVKTGKPVDLVVKTNPRPCLIAGLIAVAVLIAGLGAWAALTSISGAVVSPGVVAIKGKAKSVQHLDGGIVANIKVADGDIVSKGDVLLRLDDTLLNANIKIYRSRLQETLARKSRLEAERDGAPSITWSDEIFKALGEVPDQRIRHGQHKLFEARRATRHGQIAQLREKIVQSRNQLQGITGLSRSKASQIELIDKELDGLRVLRQAGHASLNRLLALERLRADLDGQKAELEGERAKISNAINEIQIQILQIGREFRQNVLNELRQASQEVNDQVQQLHATKQKLKRIRIAAPVSGMVHELSVHTVGGVIGPGDTVVQIVPQDGPLTIEANIETHHIDEVRLGQVAVVRLSAFADRATPEVDGEVASISPASLTDDRTQMTFYKVSIVIPPAQRARLKERQLVPGMPVETFLKARDRTVLSYLVQPLTDQIKRAFREE